MRRSTYTSHESAKKRLSFNSSASKAGSAQRSRSSSSGRASALALGSSVTRNGTASKVSRRWSNATGSQMKDPRNLSNRGLQRQMSEAILNFLQEHGYPQQISIKTLQAPTSKDFTRIFEFLVGFLIPNTKIEKKLEDEVPKILKQLQYPFPISKSTMFTIGSLHTWPTLLGALHFLTELIAYSERADVHEIMFPSNLDIEEEGAVPSGDEEILFTYYEKTYKEWLLGKDDFSNEDAMLTEAIVAKAGGSQKDHDDLKDEISKLEEELAQLESEPDSLQEAFDLKTHLETENEKLERRLAEIKRETNYQNQKLIQVEEDLKIEGIERIYDQRGSAEQNKEHLVRILEGRTQEKEKLEAQCWEKEINFSKRFSKAEKVLSEYNDTCRTLTLDSKFQEMLQAQDIELKFNHQKRQITNSSEFKERIKPILLDVQTKLSTEGHELEAQRITEEERYDQLLEICAERESEIVQIETKLSSLERELDTKKELIALEQKNAEDGLSEIEKDIQDLKQGSHIQLEKKEEEIRKLRQRVEMNQKAREEEESKATSFLMRVVNDVLEHKEKIEEAIDVANKETIKESEKMRKQKMPWDDLSEEMNNAEE